MRTLVLPTTEFARYSLISSFPKARSKPRSPLRTVSCVAGANSDDGIREASSTSTSISSIFVKGMSDLILSLFCILFLYLSILGFIVPKLNPFIGFKQSTGLPDSVSEGRLKKVFSEFGQVSHGESI